MRRAIAVVEHIDVDRRDPRFCGHCPWLHAGSDECERFRTGWRGRKLRIKTIVRGTSRTMGEAGYVRCLACRRAEIATKREAVDEH